MNDQENKVRVEYSSKFIEGMATDFVDRNNKEQTWFWFRRKGNQKSVAIAAIIKGDEDKLVITKEYRHPIGGYEYGLPAGLIDQGNSIEDTIKKEMKEETGLTVTKIHLITPPLFSSTGATDEATAIAFVEVKGKPSQKFLEASEDIETLLLNREEANQLYIKCMTGEINMGFKGWYTLMIFTGNIPTFFNK